MKQNLGLIMRIVLGLFLAAWALPAAEEPVYGHVSFVDNGAVVIRSDGGEAPAVVNLPLAPGDTILTPATGRCEIQFDNGTVVRLDKSSRLRLATVRAPSLTSNWEITTLELEKGQLYALPQSYGGEMFQVVTPNAAANLKRRVIATIRLDPEGGTSFFSDSGKFHVLYGADRHSLKKAAIKSGRPLAVTAAHAAAARVQKRDIEFTAWNEYLGRHFKELHYGISKVPPKLKFGNTALTYWAEKWSSLFGEWIYDELLGYVWRPADERFAHAERPFFHADFVRINDRLFLVPQEAWAWVPAHMGTWVWMKRGWTWIPGGWFHPGVVSSPWGYTFPSLNYYYYMYGFVRKGPRDFVPPPMMPQAPQVDKRIPILPDPVVRLIQKVEKAAALDADRRKSLGMAVPAIDNKSLPAASDARGQASPAVAPVRTAPPPPAGRGAGATRAQAGFGLARDWNPDSRWATRTGRTIRYANNAVVCPELKISSDNLQPVERLMLKSGTPYRHEEPVAAGSSPGVSNPGPSQENTVPSSDGTVQKSSQGGSGEKKDDKGK